MKIFVASNCQSYGITSSIIQLVPGAKVDALPVRLLEKESIPEDRYDVVFSFLNYEEKIRGMMSVGSFNPIPPIYFDRLHPDVTGVKSGENNVVGPTDTYHSLIAFTAYTQGINIEETCSLFNENVFESLGYFSGWPEARDQLFDDFSRCGLNVHQTYLSWMSQGDFMMSHNHPRISTLFSATKLFLAKAGVEALPMETCLLPDNLMKASVMPIYPEVAERVGIRGTYIFKEHNSSRAMALDAYVARCFRAYDQFEKGTLRVVQSMKPTFERMREILA